jgi:hypothetical protein
MAAAEAILGNRMTRPSGGFFLWLDVGNGEEFARRAWGEQGSGCCPAPLWGEISPEKPSQTPAFPMSGWRLLTTCQP